MIGLFTYTQDTINDRPIARNHRQMGAGARFILRSKFLIKIFTEAAE